MILDACGCDRPNIANYHLNIVYGRNLTGDNDAVIGTDTDSLDRYFCADHVDARVAELERQLGRDGYHIIERQTTELR